MRMTIEATDRGVIAEVDGRILEWVKDGGSVTMYGARGLDETTVEGLLVLGPIFDLGDRLLRALDEAAFYDPDFDAPECLDAVERELL